VTEPRVFLPAEHIVVDKLTKTFGENAVLREISLTIPRGETTVIVGGSGAGKTTLLRLLIGLDQATSGHIWVDGEDMTTQNDVNLNRIRQKFGMVFQYAALLDSMTVFENVAFPLREHTKLKEKEIRREVLERLSVLGLEGTEERFPAEMSGGMRKRVGLARALILKPEILIYDEPTSGLDPLTSRMVDDMIEEMRGRFGVTNVVISHDMTSAFRIAHHIGLLSAGRIVATGTPDELLAGPSEEARTFIAASGIDTDRLSRVPG
jgi:phospholipid/cholesterol/gamma-HCH transport system ATP-binding protein